MLKLRYFTMFGYLLGCNIRVRCSREGKAVEKHKRALRGVSRFAAERVGTVPVGLSSPQHRRAASWSLRSLSTSFQQAGVYLQLQSCCHPEQRIKKYMQIVAHFCAFKGICLCCTSPTAVWGKNTAGNQFV